MTTQTTSLKRITVARVFNGKTPTVKVATDLMQLTYHVDQIGREESPNGSFPKFQGEFRAVDLISGAIFTSANAVVPSVLSDAIEAAKGDASPNITGRSTLILNPDGSFAVAHEIEPAVRSVLALLDGWSQWTDVNPEVPTPATETPATAQEPAKGGKAT